ncbi:MAG: hypothetical protein ACOY5B_03010 [Spirochaetota bacterium]
MTIHTIDKVTAGESELEALRMIAATPEAQMSDLCTLILIQRGELDKFPESKKRCEAVEALRIYRFNKDDLPLLTPVTAGAASKAAINAHGLEKSLMFSLTGLEWYAIQNAEHLGLLKPKTAAFKKLSGEELVAIFENALLQSESKANWNKPGNPYEVFGVQSYEELNKAYDSVTESGKAPEKNKK